MNFVYNLAASVDAPIASLFHIVHHRRAPQMRSFGRNRRLATIIESMIERQLQQIEERVAKATPGPWYAHATDDMYATNARYVSIKPGNIHHHDNKRGMSDGDKHQADPNSVVAITLLQAPLLARTDECDENALFIAHARTDVPLLIAEVRRLQAQVGELINRVKAK